MKARESSGPCIEALATAPGSSQLDGLADAIARKAGAGVFRLDPGAVRLTFDQEQAAALDRLASCGRLTARSAISAQAVCEAVAVPRPAASISI